MKKVINHKVAESESKIEIPIAPIVVNDMQIRKPIDNTINTIVAVLVVLAVVGAFYLGNTARDTVTGLLVSSSPTSITVFQTGLCDTASVNWNSVSGTNVNYRVEITDKSSGAKTNYESGSRTNQWITATRDRAYSVRIGAYELPGWIPPMWSSSRSFTGKCDTSCSDGTQNGVCSTKTLGSRCNNGVLSPDLSCDVCNPSCGSGKYCNHAKCLTACTDEDGGYNLEYKGAILAQVPQEFGAGFVSGQDTCYGNGLLEYYCDKNVPGAIQSKAVTCPIGCANGACILNCDKNSCAQVGAVCCSGVSGCVNIFGDSNNCGGCTTPLNNFKCSDGKICANAKCVKPNDVTPPEITLTMPTHDNFIDVSPLSQFISTNEPALCRLSNTPGVSFETMTVYSKDFANNNHNFSIQNAPGITKKYIKCKDMLGNVNVNDFEITIQSSNIRANLFSDVVFDANGATVHWTPGTAKAYRLFWSKNYPAIIQGGNTVGQAIDPRAFLVGYVNIIPPSTNKYTIPGLTCVTNSETYYVQVITIGLNGDYVASNPISVVIRCGIGGPDT